MTVGVKRAGHEPDSVEARALGHTPEEGMLG